MTDEDACSCGRTEEHVHCSDCGRPLCPSEDAVGAAAVLCADCAPKGGEA